jgi:5-methylcytosine-specific restriction endonuclease McrA
MADIPEHVLKAIVGVRVVTARHLGFAPKNCCRWCHQPVKGRRKSWCSTLCVEAFNELKYARGYAVHRDQGICCNCGKDTKKDQDLIDEIRSWELEVFRLHHLATGKYATKVLPEMVTLYEAARAQIVEFDKQHPELFTMEPHKLYILQPKHLNLPRLKRFHAIEVDHIKSLAFGGLSVLSNFQSLCILCHETKTNEQKAALALERARTKRRTEPKEKKPSRWPKGRKFGK